jgi:DNA-binding CsgD family transcriptional regulator
MPNLSQSRPLALVVLIAFQIICAGFFLLDVTADALELEQTGSMLELHFLIELSAALGLLAAVAVEIVLLRRMLHRQSRLEQQVSIAAGAFYEVIDGRLSQWGLTAAEEDVARFTIKGASISDIARYRGSAEGTIKSHLNAIYRKAGVANRGELLSLLIDDLLGGTVAE